jgi:hypothetical protein
MVEVAMSVALFTQRARTRWGERRMNDNHHQPTPGFWGSRYSIGLLVMGIAAGYYLWTEHRAHVASLLPWLLFLSCPLMHLFMHHGHHGDRHHDGTSKPGGPPVGD